MYAVRGAGDDTPTPSWYTAATWVRPEAADTVPLSRLTQKVLAAVGAATAAPAPGPTTGGLL